MKKQTPKPPRAPDIKGNGGRLAAQKLKVYRQQVERHERAKANSQ